MKNGFNFLSILLICLAPQVVLAQTSNRVDSSFRFYYYDQKLSMFEIMPDQDDEVVWLGDSITDGGEWSELFPKYTTLNRGISSDNTFGVLHRLREVTKRRPAKIFLLIGINDIAKNTPVSVILKNYERIIQRILEETPGTKLFVQTLMPTSNSFKDFPNHKNKDAQVKAVNDGIRKLAASYHVGLIDLYEAFLDDANRLDSRYTNDGLHLTGNGYAHWKQTIINQLAL